MEAKRCAFCGEAPTITADLCTFPDFEPQARVYCNSWGCKNLYIYIAKDKETAIEKWNKAQEEKR